MRKLSKAQDGKQQQWIGPSGYAGKQKYVPKTIPAAGVNNSKNRSAQEIVDKDAYYEDAYQSPLQILSNVQNREEQGWREPQGGGLISIDPIGDAVNPLLTIEGLVNIPSDIAEGNYISAGMSALEAVPFLRGVNKLNKTLLNRIGTREELLDVIRIIRNKEAQNITLKPDEIELLKSTRLIGSIVNSGNPDNSLDILNALKNKANNLQDDAFEKLVGFPKSEIDEKIKKLTSQVESKKEVVLPQPAGIINLQRAPRRNDYFYGDFDVDINRSVDIERNQLPEINSGYLDSDGFYRINTLRTPRSGARVPLEFSNAKNINVNTQRDNLNAIYDRPGRSTDLTDFDIESFLYQMDNKYKTESILSKIGKRIGVVKPAPPINATTLISSISKRSDNNPAKTVLSAYKRVEDSPKGSSFIPAKSLSSDSYNRLSLPLIQRGLKNDIIDLNYHGFSTLNSMGFPTQAGLSPDLIAKEINSQINDINKLTGKKYPFAKVENGYIRYPEFTVTRKQEGGNSPIVDSQGQYDYPGKTTRIPSSRITMKDVNYPVLGISDKGRAMLMLPGMEYLYLGASYVDEIPLGK